VSAALTAPFLVAASLLVVAGALKLRSPATAGRALAVLGLPATPILVRSLATLELLLGGWALIGAARAAAGVIAGVYAMFTIVAALLTRRRASCGCFGEQDAPASLLQSVLSAAFAAAALAGASSGVHGVGWVLGHPPASAAILLVAVAASLYATVIAYTELPRAWSVWGAR
jgi:Methylamine utilisation protein MauE